MPDDIERSLIAGDTPGSRREPWDDLRLFGDTGSDILDMAWLATTMIEQTAKGSYEPRPEPGAGSNLRAFALRQHEQQYPLVVQQALVALWGNLESTVERLAVRWIEARPEVLKNKAMAKLRVRAAELLSLEESERICMLVEELDRFLADTHPAGIERLNAMLDAIGLGGELGSETRRTLIELYQLRNLYVHKAGTADRHFKKVCPWRQEAVGDRVRVLPDDIYRFSIVATRYMRVVQVRLSKQLGVLEAHLREDLRYPGAELVDVAVREKGLFPTSIVTLRTPDSGSRVLEHYKAALVSWPEKAVCRTPGDRAIAFANRDISETVLVEVKDGNDGDATEVKLAHVTGRSLDLSSLEGWDYGATE